MEYEIQCPRCGLKSNLSEAMRFDIEDKLKKKYDNELNTALVDLEVKRVELEKLKIEQETIIRERIQIEVNTEKAKLIDEVKTKVKNEEASRLVIMENELKEKSEQLQEFNKTKAEYERVKREMQEIRLKVEADAERKLSEILIKEREQIAKIESERNELRIKELQKKLDDQMFLTEQMKRKQEQGSMQLQGEVQELAIEDWLTSKFPLDGIVEIKKGQKGGDCIQIINTYSQASCGKIYYESKRTKDFQQSWLQKFKEDIQAEGADIGVLITRAMPTDMDRMGMRDGIWICTYEEFKALCFVLRDTVLKVNQALTSQENKTDKMNMLYQYLTGNQFKLQIEAIADSFKSMQESLQKEKTAMIKIWKEREKQIERVMLNTVELYGTVKGIAGTAVQEIPQLGLPESDL